MNTTVDLWDWAFWNTYMCIIMYIHKTHHHVYNANSKARMSMKKYTFKIFPTQNHYTLLTMAFLSSCTRVLNSHSLSRSISPRQVGGYSSGGFWSQCANTLSQQRLGSWLVCVHHASSFDCEIPRMFPIVLQLFKMVSTSFSRRTSSPSLHLSRARSLSVGFSPT